MGLGDVERFEVVPIRLDLGALGHGEAHADEHIFETVACLGDEMEVTALQVRGRLGEIKPLGLELFASGRTLELTTASRQLRFEVGPGRVQSLTGNASLVRIEPTHPLLQQVDRRLLPRTSVSAWRISSSVEAAAIWPRPSFSLRSMSSIIGAG